MLEIHAGTYRLISVGLGQYYHGPDLQHATDDENWVWYPLLLEVPQSWCEFTDIPDNRRLVDFGGPKGPKYDFRSDGALYKRYGFLFPKTTLSSVEKHRLSQDSQIQHSQAKGSVHIVPLDPLISVGSDTVTRGESTFVKLDQLKLMPKVLDGSNTIDYSWSASTFGGVNRFSNPFFTGWTPPTQSEGGGFHFTLSYYRIALSGYAWYVYEYLDVYEYTGTHPYGPTYFTRSSRKRSYQDRDLLDLTPADSILVSSLRPYFIKISETTANNNIIGQSVNTLAPSSSVSVVLDKAERAAKAEVAFLDSLPNVSSFPLISDIIDELEPHSLRAVETIYESLDILISLRTLDPSDLEKLLSFKGFRKVLRHLRNPKLLQELLYYISDKPRLLARLAGKATANIAGNYIGYIFGFSPMIDEAFKLHAYLKALEKTNQEARVRRSYEKKIGGKNVFVSQHSYVVARTRPEFLNLFFTLERFGLIPTAGGLYQLIPWSWAFNWFYDLGSSLDDIDGWVIRSRAWHFTYRATSNTYISEFEIQIDGYTISHDVELSSYRRNTSRFLPLPFSSAMDDNKNPFSFDRVRWKTIAALFASKGA